MAPKKRHQQKQSSKSNAAKPSASASSSGPKLQLSVENENRLRRLLLNNSARTNSAATSDDSLSVGQKTKRLRTIYDKLSCEGFSNDQIEQALSALKDAATFDAALDWLCLNLPGNELPLKFSSGVTSHANTGGSVNVLVAAREDWTPAEDLSSMTNEDDHYSVRVKGKRADDDAMDVARKLDQQSQAEWIRRYMEQQEEDDSGTWEDDLLDEDSRQKALEPRSYDVIAKEYQDARNDAAKAKEEGDRKRQEQAGRCIRKLKQELSALGISDDILEHDFAKKCVDKEPEDIMTSPMVVEHKAAALVDGQGCTSDIQVLAETDRNNVEYRSPEELNQQPMPLSQTSCESASVNETEEVGVGCLFAEDASETEVFSPEILKLQKKGKIKALGNEDTLEGLWKKGDSPKMPKAVLHQFCQRSGWEAPKFDKVLCKESTISYSVSVVRKASGRGKSRKPGGLVTLQLSDQGEICGSAEDAQNRVAAYALYHLFSDLPVHLTITEPYASLVMKWMEDEETKFEDSEEDRRFNFVNSLLESSAGDVTDRSVPKKSQKPPTEEHVASSVSMEAKVKKIDLSKEAESSYLRHDQLKRKETRKYKDMLKARSTLPIAGLKNTVLNSLKEHDVIVVCGETGSGKTTQVPQFVLDDMIESGSGGYCNIICTQPRRIAAISVAERVAEERAESSPGSQGSLVGYQVRLDSARNEKTKLLFCTTGILLRKFTGDNNLMDVTHVIVDEVHERSLLGDFLLIILKNLLEKQKQTADGVKKLKVVLMSATVDSDLFSTYFGNCPVISAEGRTHPVKSYFLEDIYEKLEYRLASDSPVSLGYETSYKGKSGSVDNHRGKKNLVLSQWGDEYLLSEENVNPHYVPSCYQSYSERTRDNLRRLNEDIIDYDLLEDLVCYIDETFGEGAILIFLPGVYEIHSLLDKLAASYQFGGQSSDWVLPLHSSIAPNDQRKVFLRPPSGVRKVIIATNIAETSITIDDVVYVIDCGKHKENRFNPRKKLTTMVEDWISQANAKQRRGRAGRVKPGICFCLYTQHRFENLMRPFQAPEMLRMPLIELCLQIKLLSLGYIKPFLLKALEPPSEEAMNSAVSLLYEVGALEGNEELTPLGHHLSKLPVDVLIGKMMLYGAIFGCLSPILSVAAFLSYKSPFLYPKDEKQNVERAKIALLTEGAGNETDGPVQSDHLVMMVAYKKWVKILQEKGVKAAQNFCNSYFLSSPVMYMIRDMRIQFATLLADIGLISLPKGYQTGAKQKDNLEMWVSDPSQPFNINSGHTPVVKAVICAGLYPNVAATEQGIGGAALNNLKQCTTLRKGGVPCWYDGRREVFIQKTSVNSDLKAFQYPFLVFLEKVETNRVFLRDTTIVSPYAILLFGGSIDIQHQSGVILIDGWLKLTAPAQIAVLFKELRSTLLSVLEQLIRNPETTSSKNEVIKSIIHLLLQEEKPLY